MEILRKKFEYKQNLIGSDFQIYPLDKRKIRVNCIGEIVQAQDFPEADNLYIIYDFILPPWFKLDYEEILEIYQDDDNKQDEMMEDWNKTASVTQSAQSTLERGENGNDKVVANFCFPFDLQMLVDQDYIEFNKAYPKHQDKRLNSEHEHQGIRYPKFPIIFMQLNSIDSMGRTRIEGYGYCHMPREPGFHEISVQTWAPVVSLSQQIHTFYLGGSMKVKDIRKIAETSFVTDENIETRLNRYNVSTESKGSVKLRFNISFTSQEMKEDERLKKVQLNQVQKVGQRIQDQQNQQFQQVNQNQQSTMNVGDQHTMRYQHAGAMSQQR